MNRRNIVSLLSSVLFFPAPLLAETPLERGRYLMNGIVACGNCHTPKSADGRPIDSMELAGAFVIEEANFTAYAPNITMDTRTGIGGWSDLEMIRAIRDGIRPDGSIIGPPMPSFLYRNMSDRDVRAIVAYLRSVKPIRNEVPESTYRIELPDSWGPRVDQVPDIPRDQSRVYGAYLASALGHCIECHTPIVEGKHDFSRIGEGGNTYDGIFGLDIVAVSRNITPNTEIGIGDWSDNDISSAIRYGVRPDGEELLPVMGHYYYSSINNGDMQSLIAYLRSLPKKPEENVLRVE